MKPEYLAGGRERNMETIIGNDTARAAELLRRGGLVAIPTETVYGLAANALDEEAVLRIYEVKQRPRFNPLILHVPDFESCRRLVRNVPDVCRVLAERFSPGPLTYLLPKSEEVPDLVTAGLDRVAIRIPAHPVALELLKALDFPLAAPSANPSGYVSPVTAQHVLEGLGGRIPYILDGGPCRVGLESTVIGFEADSIVLYRQGAVTLEEIAEVSGLPVVTPGASASSQSPGMQKSHYAPRVPMTVGDIGAAVSGHRGGRIAVVTFKDRFPTEGPVVWSHVLSPAGDLHEAARNLFRILREVDAEGADLVAAEWVPDEGIGRAINDRLDRARSVWR